MSNAYRSVLASGGTAPTGDAVAADVLTGKTFSNANAVGIAGAMVNNGAVSQTIAPGQSYTIPEGYHNGSGAVSADVSGLAFMSYQDFDPQESKSYTCEVGKTYILAVHQPTQGDHFQITSGATLMKAPESNAYNGVSVVYLFKATDTTVYVKNNHTSGAGKSYVWVGSAT